MKKGLVALLIVGAVVLGLFFWFQSNYNNMVKMDEGVQAAWSQVENVYHAVPMSTIVLNVIHKQNVLNANQQNFILKMVNAKHVLKKEHVMFVHQRKMPVQHVKMIIIHQVQDAQNVQIKNVQHVMFQQVFVHHV